jgi:hypothetical protein
MQAPDINTALAHLLRLHSEAVGRISVLEAVCVMLWKDSGRDPELLTKFFEQQAKENNERFLLNVGDTDPAMAQFLDVLKQLGKTDPT